MGPAAWGSAAAASATPPCTRGAHYHASPPTARLDDLLRRQLRLDDRRGRGARVHADLEPLLQHLVKAVRGQPARLGARCDEQERREVGGVRGLPQSDKCYEPSPKILLIKLESATLIFSSKGGGAVEAWKIMHAKHHAQVSSRPDSVVDSTR